MNRQNEITFDYLLVSYFKHQTLRTSSEKNITFLSEITEELLISWKNEVLHRATATTWNNYHTHLRALLNFAVKKNWITENILLDIPRARKPKLKKKTIDSTSFKHIFNMSR